MPFSCEHASTRSSVRMNQRRTRYSSLIDVVSGLVLVFSASMKAERMCSYQSVYSETCLSDHLHRATTSLQRPRQNSPTNSYRKAPRANVSTATTCLMWTTTARTSTQCTKLHCRLRPVGVAIIGVVTDYCLSRTV